MRDRDLVRLYWPVDLRPAFDALFAVDDAMADVVAQSTQPALGAIKLAWWRERLEELDRGEVSAEPRLRAAAAELLPRGIAGQRLASLEDGWVTLLDAEVDPDRLAERGAKLFELAAQLLGQSDARLAEAGALTAVAQAARTGLAVNLDQARGPERRIASYRFPRGLRPLTGLAALAARDIRHSAPFEQEATPARAWTILRHRLTGRL